MDQENTPARRPLAPHRPLAPEGLVHLPGPEGGPMLTLQIRTLPEDRQVVEIRVYCAEAPGAWVRLDRELWEASSRLRLAESCPRAVPRGSGGVVEAVLRWFGLPVPGAGLAEASPPVRALTIATPPGPRPGFRVMRKDPKPELAAGSRPEVQVLLRDTDRAEPLGLYVDDQAWQHLRTQLDWEKQTRRNLVEQGGLMLGRVQRDPVTHRAFAKVDRFVLAEGARAGASRLALSTEDFARMYGRIEELNASGAVPAGHVIVGWYHTHPGGLDVFMSNVDMQTQRCLFPEEYHFALVLNPHSRVFRCYQGAAATPCGVAVVENPVAQVRVIDIAT